MTHSGLAAAIAEIRTAHHGAPADERSAALARSRPIAAVPELTEFYQALDGCRFFAQRDAPYRIVSAAEVRRVRIDISGKDEDRFGDASLHTIAELHDGNYLAIDLVGAARPLGSVVDAFHETFHLGGGYTPVIADSFVELLERILRSGGKYFWLAS